VSLPNQSTFTKALPKRLISSDDEDSEAPTVAFLNPTPRLSGDKMKVEARGIQTPQVHTIGLEAENEELESL
jgi:hypothetical protein